MTLPDPKEVKTNNFIRMNQHFIGNFSKIIRPPGTANAPDIIHKFNVLTGVTDKKRSLVTSYKNYRRNSVVVEQ